jgi:hypothetical protein
MAITLDSTGITFNDSSVQGTKYDGISDVGYLLNIATFTATGTWYKPAGCTKVLVKLVGGGGGAAGYCESGGAGGYSEKVIDVTAISSVAVTIGGGGASVAYYAAAAQGGTTSFGTYCSATGGYGANANYSHTGGISGVGSSGDINLYGGLGTGHTNNGNHFPASQGGTSYFGSSGKISRATTSNKLYNGAPGSGGPGARTNDGAGGAGIANGESGVVIVYAYS